MKKTFAKLLSLIMLSSMLLTGCKYDVPAGLTTGTSEGNVDPFISELGFGNYDYSVRPYLSNNIQMYQNKVFYKNTIGEIVYYDINELDKNNNLRENSDVERSLPAHYTCPLDDEHKHDKFNGLDICPIRIWHDSCMVLDVYESAGGYPVIYNVYAKPTGETNDPFDQSGYNLYRYTASDNQSEKLVELPGYCTQIMAYGDRVYMSLKTADKKYFLMMYDKKTKETASLAVERNTFFLHAEGNDVYYCINGTGELYKTDVSLSGAEKVFAVAEVYAISSKDSTPIQIYDGYIYYRDNFTTHDVQVHVTGVPDDEVENPQFIHPISYDIRRVPLDSPSEESRLVASGVFEGDDFGFANGCLYYTPVDIGVTIDKAYYNFSSGRFCKVDLTTLETVDILTDCGFMFDNYYNGYCNGKFIISTIRPLGTECSEYFGDLAGYDALYVIETGEIYFIKP